MFGIGMTELMVILIIGLVVIGPKKLPGLARSLGRSLAEFRRASEDMRREFLDVAQSTRVDPPAADAKPDSGPEDEAPSTHTAADKTAAEPTANPKGPDVG